MSMQPVDDRPIEIKKPLLEVHPEELKFTFEVKKQSSCAVHLTNLSDQYVAFKVKTTSPKKYCVRPNTGIVKPKSTCSFIVTMQAQKSAPLDMHCKDKFLIQSAVAPFGTAEEEIMPGLFAKDSGKYIEECKLRVILASPSHSPVLSPVNGVKKQEQPYVISTQNEKLLSGAEGLPPPQMDAKLAMAKEELKSAQVVERVDSPSKSWEVKSKPQEVVHSPSDDNTEDAKLVMAKEELKSAQVAERVDSPSKNWEMESKLQEILHSPSISGKHKDVEGRNLKLLSEDIKEQNSLFRILDSKLIEAESIITRLEKEKMSIIQEKEILRQELATVKRKSSVRRVQRGFPPLFVCMVALISLFVGFLLRS